MDIQENIGWYAHPSFDERSRLFEDKYQMIDVISTGDETYSRTKTRIQVGRHCLFCNRDYPDAKFNNAAHLLPRSIGNTDLYSSFECDECNNKFSLFETDLASYLGIGRSIAGLKSERKAPGFPGIGMKTKSIMFNGNNILVVHMEKAERDREMGTTSMRYQKPTYTPSNVYKLFLKCALSILPHHEVVSNFQVALEFLGGKNVLNGAHVNGYRFHLGLKMPFHAYIFKKKNPLDLVPTYIISFYFDNSIINLPVLLHKEDMQFYNQSLTMPIAPPYFLHGNNSYEMIPSAFIDDLSSPYKLKYETEEFKMEFNLEDLENAAMFDPKTGEEKVTSYNPSGSKYFILTKEGVTYSKEQLKELSELIEKEFSKR